MHLSPSTSRQQLSQSFGRWRTLVFHFLLFYFLTIRTSPEPSNLPLQKQHPTSNTMTPSPTRKNQQHNPPSHHHHRHHNHSALMDLAGKSLRNVDPNNLNSQLVATRDLLQVSRIRRRRTRHLLLQVEEEQQQHRRQGSEDSASRCNWSANTPARTGSERSMMEDENGSGDDDDNASACSSSSEFHSSPRSTY